MSDEIQRFQDYGVRKWAGDDLIELQSEPLAALQALVEPYAPCIIQGCEVTENGDGGIKVSPGLVALKGKDSKGNACVKIARFAGIESETSIYLTLACETVNRAYGDGKVKDIAYDYKAVASTQCPDEPFLEISGKEVPRLVDTLGITQKLDREGGEAKDTVVGFTGASTRSELKPGSRLGILIGQIKKWLTDLGCLAFKNEVSISDIETTLANKLNGIEDNANKYTHPSSAAGAKTSGLYKIATDANGHVIEAAAVAKSDITDLGIPAQDTVYTHPTNSGNKHIPDGGSSGQYLKYDSAGTAVWATPGSNTATASAAGFMSATDKTKLDGIATGANKTIVDSALSSSSINPVQNKVVKAALDTYAPKASIPMGVWRSNNGNRHSSSATTTLTAKQACTFTLKWLVSSEGSYDKLTITVSGTTLVNAVSGENKGTLAETPLAAGAAIALAYSKDGSNNTGRDLAEISDFYITVNGVLIEITSFNINAYFTVTNGSYFFAPVLNVNAATTNLPGFMSAADKTKLDGIATGANAYTHPSSATGAKTSGLYKIATDANGHVTGAAAVAKSDITALGIPDKNTTYSVATASADGLMSAADKTKLNGIAAGAQVNPAYATAAFNSTTLSSTDGCYQTGACDSGSYNNSVGKKNTVARGDHQHSLFIANATTSKPGLMSKADKTNLDLFAGTPKVIYACSFGVKDGNVSKGQEKAIPGVSVSLVYFNNTSGKYVQVTTKQSLYTYIIPIVTGQSAAPAFFDGNSGSGSFRIRLRHGTTEVTEIGGASLVLIGI